MSSVPLAELADVTMGQSPDSTLIGEGSQGLPFLQGSAEFGRISPTSLLRCARPPRKAKAGSILISVRAPVGQMNAADQDYCIGRGLGAFAAKPGIANTNYLKHAVEQNLPWLHRRSQGSTFAAISADVLRSLPVPGQTPQRQDEIADLFAAVDAAIEATEAMIEKHQQIKAGLMHDLFTRGVLPNGSLRPARADASDQYQLTKAGWIPIDWSLTTCEAVCERVIDCKNRTPPETPEGFPVIRTPNVRHGEFVDDELAFTDARSFATWTSRGKPMVGDVVITREAPVGEICMIPERHPNACLGQRMMLYRPNGALIDSRFFLFALQSSQIQSRLDLISGGSTVGHVRVGDIRTLWMFQPKSMGEQECIAEALHRASQRLAAEHALRDKLQQQKQGLMQDLLTGKVRVPTPSKEATA